MAWPTESKMLWVSCVVLYQRVHIENSEVSLHVKRENARVTSHSTAWFRNTSSSSTVLGLTSRCNVSTGNRDIDTSKYLGNSPLNKLVNKNERPVCDDILARVIEDYRQQVALFISSVFVFISHWDVHIMPLRELTGYTCKSRCLTWVAFCEQFHNALILMTSFMRSLFTRTHSRFTCSETSLLIQYCVYRINSLLTRQNPQSWIWLLPICDY